MTVGSPASGVSRLALPERLDRCSSPMRKVLADALYLSSTQIYDVLEIGGWTTMLSGPVEKRDTGSERSPGHELNSWSVPFDDRAYL